MLISRRPLTDWVKGNPFDQRFSASNLAELSVERMQGLAGTLPIIGQPNVVAIHHSKSVTLPVVEFQFDGGRIVIRDNFYNLEVLVDWYAPLDVPYSVVYGERLDWKWYEESMKKCEGYTWRGWSQEELLDPRITRVPVTKVDGTVYWNETTPEKKDRWNARMVDLAWIRDWSSNDLIVEGEFGPNATFYVCPHLYLEGISHVESSVQHYSKGNSTKFGFQTNWENISSQLMAITGHNSQLNSPSP